MTQINNSSIYNDLKKRILILDGAMGTAIQEYHLAESDFRGSRLRYIDCDLKGNNDLLNISAPHIIEAIHDRYIQAGADIIETNTFNSNSISQGEYHCSEFVEELNQKGVEIAKRAAAKANRKIYIAGSIGPTGKTLSLATDIAHPESRSIDFDTLAAVYFIQIKALIESGVDLLLIETIFDGLNAKAALYAVNQVFNELSRVIPVMVSATINDKSGRLLTGQHIEALYTSLSHFPILSFGLNCSFGATDLRPFIERLSQHIPCAISIYPNAGLPNAMGQYDESPEYTATCLANMADEGFLNMVGGCCGTTPEHIRVIREKIQNTPPRKIPTLTHKLCLSGLDNVIVDSKTNNFINIGERTNVSGSRKFARLIAEHKYSEAIHIARKQIEDGAAIIDINMDDAMLNSQEEMTRFIRIINTEPDVAKAVLMIDSSHWPTLLAGLKNAPGKCIVNSISLKEGEADFIQKAEQIKMLGAAVVIMAFDENGQATTYKQKIAIASRAYRLLIEKVKFNPNDIIFDVNVLSIGTGLNEHNNYGVDFIQAVTWIKQNLPGAKCSGGISNLSFAFRGNNTIRETMHSVFLFHAIRAGLDMAIVNPSLLQIYDTIDPKLLQVVEDVVLNRHPQATEQLIAIADNYRMNPNNVQNVVEEWRNTDWNNRLIYSLIKGIDQYLTLDLAEALTHYKNPVQIIEGPLMQGMERIGELFSEGKMFLPQVVKSARVMKEAVDILQPIIHEYNVTTDKVFQRPRIILATVKGDVHDIGKNIVNIILTCNNIDVIDLGVMVDNDAIIKAIHEYNVDFIGVSGLITPSLYEMEKLCDLLEHQRCHIPLIVGGATTSTIHTAVKLAPKYHGGVISGGDASQTASIIKRLLNDKLDFLSSLQRYQDELRQQYLTKDIQLISLSEARARAYQTTNTTPLVPICKDNIFIQDYNLQEIANHIDWTPFFHFWGFKGQADFLLSDNEQAFKLYQDAIYELAECINMKRFKASVVVEFFNAIKQDEAIILENGEKLEMLRQQTDNQICYSLSDFYHEKIQRPIGLFTVVIKDKLKDTDSQNYSELLRASLTARLTEAFIKLLHEKIASDRPMIRPAFGYASCPDHSLKADLFRILKIKERLDISLTENYSIQPSTAICGLLIPHPEARYFSITKIDHEQCMQYAKRKGFSSEETKKMLSFLL